MGIASLTKVLQFSALAYTASQIYDIWLLHRMLYICCSSPHSVVSRTGRPRDIPGPRNFYQLVISVQEKAHMLAWEMILSHH